VRVARQAAGARSGRGDFLPVVHQVLLAEAPFQEGPRVHTRRAVRLEEHQVAPVLPWRRALAGMEEVVEAGLEQIGRAGIAGDVAAQFAIRLVGPHHHGQRVPAHERRQALFKGQIAGEGGLRLGGHRVHVGRVQLRLPAHALRPRQAHQLIQHEARALRAFGGDQGQEGLAPLGGLLRVGVGQGGRSVGQRGGQSGVHGSTL